MRPVLIAASFYAGSAFGIGFLLGIVRVFLLLPFLGELGAVLLELPVILAASALLARHAVNRYALQIWGERLTMGGLAFILLMLLEITLTILIDGSVNDWFDKLTTVHGAVGLAGQVIFALLPLFFRPQKQ